MPSRSHERPAVPLGPRASTSTSRLAAAWVAALEIADGVVVAVRSVLNADKLTHVAPR